MMRMFHHVMLLTAMMFLFATCGQAMASNFEEYQDGVLRINPPRQVWVYKAGSTVTHKIITVSTTSLTITDARWQGDNIAVYIEDNNGKNKIYLYSSFVQFKVIN